MKSDMSRIPLEIAHQILGTFGITRPTRAYQRWVKEDGFDLQDFDEVLFESTFIFTIDWRASLQEELDSIRDSLDKIDAKLEVNLDKEGESGYVSCAGRRAPIAYRPSDESDFDLVVRALQSVVPNNVEFRASPDNDGSDTMVFAVLPRDEWAELERIAPDVIRYFFEPIDPTAD